MKTNLLLLACVSAAVMANRAHAEGPLPIVSYEGLLPQTESPALSKRISFSLYDTQDAQTASWGPQQFDNVAILNGRFNVLLGTTDTSGRPLPDLSGSAPRYLAITVDGRELQPRQRLLAALSGLPASQTSSTAATPDRPDPPNPSVPVGSIIAYWNAQAPAGWLPCDGSNIPEGPQYEKLKQLTGQRVPDLRGLFLRGLGQHEQSSYRYPGDVTRRLGEFQLDDFKAHAHPFDDYTFSENTGTAGNAWGHSGRSDIDNSPGSPFKHTTAIVGGEETRPKNAGVYWIIKY
ncbi:phage tail protein [Methyloterricola oryzae]|uniref:phage tail protein n=1 Tax=Methyloterricola oryzae TaxID=1495050 RepID=UPI0005EB624F|nr:phage tail protein [Methyloterricola oryzae]